MTRLRGRVIRARRIDLSTSRWRARAIRRGGALRGAQAARAPGLDGDAGVRVRLRTSASTRRGVSGAVQPLDPGRAQVQVDGVLSRGLRELARRRRVEQRA